MKQVRTNQKTYGKSTKQLIKKLCPSALRSSKVGNDVVVRDANGVCVCTWHKQRNDNGLIVIH